MAEIKFDGGYMPLPINIKRGNPIPLDTTSVHYPTFGETYISAYDNAHAYAKSNPVAYVGQIITVCEGDMVNGSFVPDMSRESSGVYYIADKKGTLVKLINAALSVEDLREDIEVDYNKISIIKTDDKFSYAIITTDRPFKAGTSDLFINGIKYNNSEYEEIPIEGKEGICESIKFSAFEIIPQVDGVGDEITIMADYE